MELSNEHIKILQGKLCPYCGVETIKTDSSTIYHGYDYGKIYMCPKCKAYVGCHQTGPHKGKAKGRVANERLRKLKTEAHRWFDQLWQGRRDTTRKDEYSKLGLYLQIPKQYTHIGMFSERTCLKVIEYSKQQLDKRYGKR